MKNKIKKYLLIWWPIAFAIVLFCLFIPLADSIYFNGELKSVVATIMFTMFGFSITSLTIIVGFMKESRNIFSAIKKGYFITIVSLIIWAFLISVLSLFATLFDFPCFVFISISSSGMFVILYFVYVIIQLLRFLIKANKE